MDSKMIKKIEKRKKKHLYPPLEVSNGIPGLLCEERWETVVVQYYQKLNVMTVKNTYPLPLIPDIINQILDSKARYLTKLDVCWGYNNV